PTPLIIARAPKSCGESPASYGSICAAGDSCLRWPMVSNAWPNGPAKSCLPRRRPISETVWQVRAAAVWRAAFFLGASNRLLQAGPAKNRAEPLRVPPGLTRDEVRRRGSYLLTLGQLK